MLRFIDKLSGLTAIVNNGVELDGILDYVYESFKDYIPYERIGIALLDGHGCIYAEAARSDNEPRLKQGYHMDLNETSLLSVVEKRESRIVNDYLEHLLAYPASETTKMMLDEGLRSSVAFPIVINGTSVGVIFFSSKDPYKYNESCIPYIRMVAQNIGMAIEKNLLVDDLILTSIIGFAKLVEAKDNDTGQHIERIQSYSKIIAENLARSDKYNKIINSRFIKDIYNFSPIHDIGKVGIPDSILLKPGKLTESEFEIMKTHTTLGADILMKASNNLLRKGRHLFDMGIQIILSHHEKYDGRGYPYGLEGEDIPLAARIVTVADVLDALMSKRVYKEAFPTDKALGIIKMESGKSFDPDVVDALFAGIDNIMQIYDQLRK